MRTLLALCSILLAAPAAADGVARYGAPVPEGETVPVAVALADPEAHVGTPRRFEGRIGEVCQKMGCWLMLEEDGQAIRVATRDHAWFVPRDVQGRAVVYGTLGRRQAAPSAEGAAAPPEPGADYRIEADGIEIAG
ncbi:DUF4920 domain-containing protein [Coralloluteibacterium thermophilus]|uniref:DUF4920 domain-containing protein n=1 Tax=Coralloluteibacterium thermophilum TaxID=2707049 RepID=A0ABV9NLZ2_9GAMM